MDERPRLDLKKYALPAASKGYLLRIVVYVAVLMFLGYYLFTRLQSPSSAPPPVDAEITDVQVLVSDSL